MIVTFVHDLVRKCDTPRRRVLAKKHSLNDAVAPWWSATSRVLVTRGVPDPGRGSLTAEPPDGARKTRAQLRRVFKPIFPCQGTAYPGVEFVRDRMDPYKKNVLFRFVGAPARQFLGTRNVSLNELARRSARFFG